MRRALLAIPLVLLCASRAPAEGEAPATVKVTKEDVAFHVDLNGAFDAKDAALVAFKPQVFGEEAEVLEARVPGRVVVGDVLVRFKTERIDDAIRAAENDLAVARAASAVQSEDFARQREVTAAGVAKAEFEAKNAADALKNFIEIEMPLRLEEADHGLQGTRNWITDQTEELAQLEKMYKSDDLTEETEDIVLKRARRELDRTKKSLDFQTRRSKVMREVDLPREQQSLALEAKRTAAERDKVAAVSRLQETQAKLDLDRAKANLEKQERDTAKLVADRAFYELKAPVTGYAMPGSLVRGKWTNADETAALLRRRGKVGAGAVLYTVVRGGGWVAASAPEATLSWIREGQEATIVPTILGANSYSAKVAPVVPATSGAEFPVDLELSSAQSEVPLGMTCRIRVDTGKRSTILVPQTAVEDAGFEKFVHVLGADGKFSRRAVTLGQPHEKRVEITSGLAEGDVVLEAAPAK